MTQVLEWSSPNKMGAGLIPCDLEQDPKLHIPSRRAHQCVVVLKHCCTQKYMQMPRIRKPKKNPVGCLVM